MEYILFSPQRVVVGSPFYFKQGTDNAIRFVYIYVFVIFVKFERANWGRWKCARSYLFAQFPVFVCNIARLNDQCWRVSLSGNALRRDGEC